ncbi:MAG: ATP synthase F1 subunit delta, partial [Candidatus Latescibacteria bacterium]|nr:ATP synthase F1 subunit delta [Candidatus Latescibacterota bacterium]
HRESAMAEIVDAGLSRLDEKEGIVTAVVTSHIALTDVQKSALTTQLETRTGKTVRLEADIDESITGGFSVRIGGAIYDATVAAQLRRIREQMTRPL